MWGLGGSPVHSSAHNCAHVSHNTTGMFCSVILCTCEHGVVYKCAQALEHVGQYRAHVCTQLRTNVHKPFAGMVYLCTVMHTRVHSCAQTLLYLRVCGTIPILMCAHTWPHCCRRMHGGMWGNFVYMCAHVLLHVGHVCAHFVHFRQLRTYVRIWHVWQYGE